MAGLRVLQPQHHRGDGKVECPSIASEKWKVEVEVYTGVVIGENMILGERVRLRRHPIGEDDVVIHAGATVLGRITIGKGSVVVGNVWLTDDVAPGGTVTQAGAKQDLMADGLGI